MEDTIRIAQQLDTKNIESINHVADLLLDAGTLLLSSGAHLGRIARNLNRVSDTWGYTIEMDSWYTGIIITIKSKDNTHLQVTRFRRCTTHGVHFDTISQVSLLTWKIADYSLAPHEFEAGLKEIKQIHTHSRLEILLGVGVACASLCMVSGGDWRNGIFAFVASFTGMLVRQETAKHNFNIFITVVLASFITSLIASVDVLSSIGGASPEKTLATSVLYLVPGVPLINSLIDLIEGYIPSSVARGIYASFLLLAIAIGITLSLLILGLDNFYSLK